MKELTFPKLGERCYFETLANGLTVYVLPKIGYSKAYALFATNYGGQDERFSTGNRWRQTPAGVAHFLEHKMFDMPDGNALQTFLKLGASPNAFTADDITGYHFSCTDGFYDNLRHLLTFVTTPYFTEESVAKEQGIIGQEIRMLEDSPGFRNYLNLKRGLYHNHTVRNNVAGTVESIARITPEILTLCHKTFYHPGNMVLCVVGNVEPRRVFQLAASTVPSAEKQTILRDHGEAEPQQSVLQEVICEMDVAVTSFLLGFKADPKPSLRYKLAGELAAELLAGKSSPLYAKMYQDGMIDNSFDVEFDCNNEIAHFVFGGESVNPAGVADAILSEAVRIAWNGLDDQLFRRVKKALYGSRVRALNSFEHLCRQMAYAHFNGYQYLEFAEAYDQITCEEVEELLRESITGERSTLAILKPKGV